MNTVSRTLWKARLESDKNIMHTEEQQNKIIEVIIWRPKGRKHKRSQEKICAVIEILTFRVYVCGCTGLPFVAWSLNFSVCVHPWMCLATLVKFIGLINVCTCKNVIAPHWVLAAARGSISTLGPLLYVILPLSPPFPVCSYLTLSPIKVPAPPKKFIKCDCIWKFGK